MNTTIPSLPPRQDRLACLAFAQQWLTPILFSVMLTTTLANDWCVATNGTPAGQGTSESPWDLESTLQGRRDVRPGDTVWIQPGSYRHPNRKNEAMGYEVRLAGKVAQPICIRAMPGQRVTIDGGLTVQPPTLALWLRDLEILVSENLTRSRRLEETGSHPQSYDRPWGGLNINAGAGCKFINLVIHDNAQGVSWWTGSQDSELYGCLIYDNGWEAPDRGHGHAIYTQNNEGLKTISDCIMTGGYGYTLHAYGSSRADVNNYLVTGNVLYQAGPFLMGSGKPSHHLQVLTNYLYGVPMQLGYNAPYNEDAEVMGNLIVNGSLSVNQYRRVVNEGNLVLRKVDARPAKNRVIIRPNRFDPNRAHVIILNWEKSPQVTVQPDDFFKAGEPYRVINPRDFYGTPCRSGSYDGKGIILPMPGEFACFILMKNTE